MDPDRLASFRQRIAQLENALRPFALIEKPPAGRLVLAIQHSADSGLLAVYDDRSFCGLLEAVKPPAGLLDLELLSKSWRGEVFDGGYLEGIHEEVVVTPTLSAIVVARPESVVRFLLSSQSVVGAFADGCLIVDGSQYTNAARFETDKLAYWERVIHDWLSGKPAADRRVIGISQQACELIAGLRERVARALEKEGARA